MNELTGAIPAHLTERPELQEPKNQMGKDDFMKLLMAQLRNQDPLNPMDHKEFSAQLAQFASLEKLTKIGTGIEKLEGGMGEEAKLQALGMIGKQVKASGAEVNLIENQPVDIAYAGEPGFQPLKVSIFGGDGKLVRELDLDPKKNLKSVKWDGRDQEGKALPSGQYMFRLAGVGADGKSKEVQADLSGKVVGVEMNGKNPVLVVETPNGKSRVEIAKIQEIAAEAKTEPTTSKDPKVASTIQPAEVAPKPSPDASPEAAPAEDAWQHNPFEHQRGFMEYGR